MLEQHIETLFPFHFTVDRELRLETVGKRLTEVAPEIVPGALLTDVLDLQRPLTVATFRALSQLTEMLSIFGVISCPGLRLRGQILCNESVRTLTFVGAPQVTRLSELPALGLHERDFALHDSRFDFLMLLQETDTMQAENLALGAERESALADNRAKSVFLANMSHEVRTPLNAIIGLTQLCLKTALTDKQRDYVDKSHKAANNLLAVINDILDFSRIAASGFTPQMDNFELAATITHVESVIGELARAKYLRFQIDMASDVPMFLIGDSLRLGQILINLLGNAVKFTETGKVIAQITLKADRGDTVELEFKVHDTGIGLTDEQRGRLMQPFVQADSSTTRQYGGTGLGLAISKRLVTEMRGELTISSVFGKGSTFSFNAHFGRGTPIETSRTVSDISDEALAAALVWLGKASLLVVDDNTFNQQVAAETLESAGAAVTVASNGREALACLASAHFDIVFMDLQMPVMDGYEATRHIRATPALADQCVIAMTANAMTGDRDRCIEGGMDDFISKPIEPAQLYIVIHKWLVRCMAPDRNQARTDQPADAATQPTPAPSTTHSQPSDQMPIDLAVLRNLLKNDPVKVAIFASKFAETARTILAEMHSASERQDLSGLSALAHKLKSSAATVGALGMASTCNNLESAGHDSNWPGARACLTVLTEIVQQATKQVEDSAS